MKIRFMGTAAELAALKLGRVVLELDEVSEPYANRGQSRLARVYAEGSVVKAAGPIVVEAVRVREVPESGTREVPARRRRALEG